MTTRKIFIPIVFFTAMLFFLSGCGKEESQETILTPNTPVNQEQTSMTEGEIPKISKEEIEKIIFAEGFESPEYYQMMKENAQMIQMNIVSQEIYQNKNPDSCNKLQVETQKTNCKDNFYMSQANETKDESFCEKISEEQTKKYCTQNVLVQSAREKGDATLCDQVTEEYTKKDCKNSVYIEIARKTGNPETCEKIEDEGYKSMCTQEANSAKAEETRIQEMKDLKVKMQEETPDQTEEIPVAQKETQIAPITEETTMEIIPEEIQ